MKQLQPVEILTFFILFLLFRVGIHSSAIASLAKIQAPGELGYGDVVSRHNRRAFKAAA